MMSRNILDPHLLLRPETLGSANAREGPRLDPQKVDMARPRPRRENVDAPAWPIPIHSWMTLLETKPRSNSFRQKITEKTYGIRISFVFFGLIIRTELWLLFSFNHPQSILIFEILQIQCEAITILSYLYIICHTWFDNMSFLFIYKLPILVMWCCLITVSPTAVSKDLTVHRSFDRFIATRFHQKTAILQRHFSVLKPQDSPCGIELKGRLHWTLMTPVCWVCFLQLEVDLVWLYELGSREVWNWSLCSRTLVTISNQRHRLFKVGSTFRSARSKPSSVKRYGKPLEKHLNSWRSKPWKGVISPLCLQPGLQNQQSPL